MDGQMAAWPSDARDQETGSKIQSKIAGLIPVADLRPLTGDGPIKKRKQCPDCRYCQGCSQDRCRLCRRKRKPGPVKLSLTEQIARYDKINRPKGRKPAPKSRP